jgi:hypothetical protein
MPSKMKRWLMIKKTFSTFEELSFMQDMPMQAIITLSLRTKTNGMSSMMNSYDKSNTQKSSKKALEGRIKTLLMK